MSIPQKYGVPEYEQLYLNDVLKKNTVGIEITISLD